jgi:arylformamidase
VSAGETTGGGWIDVSVPVRDGMVHWPTDPPVRIALADSIERGDPANVTRLDMSAHTGTHMDAPRHFIADGPAIDELPLEVAIGPARVIEISDPRAVREGELRDHEPQAGERLLLKTQNSSRRWWDEGFDEGFVYIEPGAAELLAEARVQLIGVDYLSVGDMEEGAETHRALLGAGVWIVEGLNLSRTGSGDYELICLPARIVGSDGAPVRALLRQVE